MLEALSLAAWLDMSGAQALSCFGCSIRSASEIAHLQLQGHGHRITTEARLFPRTHRLARDRVFPYLSTACRHFSGMHEVSRECESLEHDVVLLRSSE